MAFFQPNTLAYSKFADQKLRLKVKKENEALRATRLRHFGLPKTEGTDRYELCGEQKIHVPVLVVCYTNHALDQFLEGILKFCPTEGSPIAFFLLYI